MYQKGENGWDGGTQSRVLGLEYATSRIQNRKKNNIFSSSVIDFIRPERKKRP